MKLKEKEKGHFMVNETALKKRIFRYGFLGY
jgi:hypothetical protein